MILLTLTLSLLTNAYAGGCDCRVNIGGRSFTGGKTEDTHSCYQKFVAPITENPAHYCGPRDETVEIKWGCGGNGAIRYIECKGAGPQIAADLVGAILFVPELNNRLAKKNFSADCDNLLAGAGPQKPGHNSQKILLTFSSEEAARASLRPFVPGAILDRPTDKWEFEIHLPNDNKGFGLLDRDEKNDFGNTHGYKFRAAKDVTGKLHLTIEYFTNLYTEAIKGSFYRDSDGIMHASQYFLEENMLKLILDNKDQKKPLYWVAGVGWQNLNASHLRNFFVSSARQQQAFHQMLNSVSPGTARTYDYAGRDKNEHGLYIEGAVGHQWEKVLSASTRVKTFAEIGGGASTINSNIAHINVSLGASLDFQPKSWSHAARIGVIAEREKYNGDPSQRLHSLFAEYGSESFRCGGKITERHHPRGPGYREFDDDGEKIMDLYCKATY